MRIAMITHGDDGGFWSIVRRGAEDAAATLRDVTLDYQGSAGDAKAQSDMIKAALNQGANALAVSAPDTGAIGSALDRAQAARIPVVTLNSGSELVSRCPGRAHATSGQSEQAAGVAAGERLGERGRPEGAVHHPRGEQHRPAGPLRGGTATGWDPRGES